MNHFTGSRRTKRAGCAERASFGRRSLSLGAALLVGWLSLGAARAATSGQPFVLERSLTIPAVPAGPYSDYLAVDLAGNRLFATPQAAKSVAVLDLRDGRVLQMISGIGNPHGVFYNPTLKRLFVADGESGDVKVFSGEDYSLIKAIPLARGADGFSYDPHSKWLYVNNGGEEAGMKHALISVVDTVRMEKVTDIPIAASDLEASVIDSRKQLLYVNLVNQAEVAVVNLKTRRVIERWKLPAGERTNIAIALDAVHSRLYVGCRNSSMRGALVVLNSANGQPIATLPIGGWVDGISIDWKRQRVYASTGVGYLDTYAIGPHDVYRRLPAVDTAVMAKTSLYSSELDRMYVSVPHLGDTPAQILVFKPSQ